MKRAIQEDDFFEGADRHAGLRVSRNSVVAAYSELVADGLIHATPGSGLRVTGAAPLSGMPLAGMHALIEAAHSPASVLQIEDSDANSIYIRY